MTTSDWLDSRVDLELKTISKVSSTCMAFFRPGHSSQACMFHSFSPFLEAVSRRLFGASQHPKVRVLSAASQRSKSRVRKPECCVQATWPVSVESMLHFFPSSSPFKKEVGGLSPASFIDVKLHEGSQVLQSSRSTQHPV